MDNALDVAFVIAVTAFIKTQFEVKGKAVLFWAFVICLFFGIAPLIADLLPVSKPFLNVVLYIGSLFLAATGSYDALIDIKRKKAK